MIEGFIQKAKPNVEVTCRSGRPGAFEVKIDNTLVFSKLKTMAFPDPKGILENINRKEKGLPFIPIKEEVMENCVLL